MRVLHVTPTYVPAWRYGGPIRSVHGLCSALARGGAEVDVFTTSVDGPMDMDVPSDSPVEIDGVKVWYFRANLLRRLYMSAGMARALRVRVPAFDLVHLHSVFLWPTWFAARQARRAGVPYVLSPRGMLVKELVQRKSTLAKKTWIALIERRNAERAAAVHATSVAEADELARFGMKLNEVFVVPNGVGDEVRNAGEMPPEVRAVFEDPAPVLLYLGRINWKKGLDRLIRALAQVPGARLLIVGNDEEGHTEPLARCAREAGVRQRVVFAGPMDGAAKTELYRRAHLFVLPSYSENFGIVVLEAMAQGCPVIVTRGVGAAAVVEDANAGLVVAQSTEAIACAIAELLADPARRAAMGRAGRERVLADYTWDRVAAQMLERYRRIVERRQAPAIAA
jgi:glycosyltransferase involved in cell wall biosynthesis